MRPTATEGVVWSVCTSVCLSVGHVPFVSPAKTTEPIEMPFGRRLTWAPGTMYYMGVEVPHGKGQFWG